MADETKSEQILMRVTLAERQALEFLRTVFPDRFDGLPSVLRVYSVNEAVAAYQAAMAVKAEA